MPDPSVFATVKHDRIDKQRDKDSNCSQAEWERILTSVLLDGDPVPDVEVSAAIEQDTSLTITFENKIQGKKASTEAPFKPRL